MFVGNYARKIEDGGAPVRSMAIDRLLTGDVREQLRELINTEDLLLESLKDLVKDELKGYIREKIDADEELKVELKEAISYYFISKARSVYAEMKAARAAARLGIRILPEDLQDDVGEALVGLFERELGNLLERAL